MGIRHLTALSFLGCAALAYAQTPVIAPGGVLNGASFDKTGQPIPAGALVSIFGTNLSAASASADSVPLSTTLSGVMVTFNGIAAPLKDVVHSAANGDQINAQVPWEVLAVGANSGTAQVVVTRNGVASAPLPIILGSASPGIFTFPGGVGQAVAYGNSDGAIAAQINSGLPFTSHPAKIGDPTTLVILATGCGPVSPAVTTGSNANDGQLHQTTTVPRVSVGGVQAQVIFAGMTPQFVGVYQLNIVIAPGTPTGNAVPIQITMNGVTSRNDATIAVSQ
jgi:uncharacterized protein (TIGR03437 family)